MNCSVSPAVPRSRKALREKGSQGFVRCLKVLQPVEKPVEIVENLCIIPPLRSDYFYTRPPFFFFYAHSHSYRCCKNRQKNIFPILGI